MFLLLRVYLVRYVWRGLVVLRLALLLRLRGPDDEGVEARGGARAGRGARVADGVPHRAADVQDRVARLHAPLRHVRLHTPGTLADSLPDKHTVASLGRLLSLQRMYRKQVEANVSY